jgi:hypothetical protein
MIRDMHTVALVGTDGTRVAEAPLQTLRERAGLFAYVSTQRNIVARGDSTNPSDTVSSSARIAGCSIATVKAQRRCSLAKELDDDPRRVPVTASAVVTSPPVKRPVAKWQYRTT